MAAGGTPANVTLGPGRLYYAPIGTADPTSASVALPSAWIAVGYTEEGTTITTDITTSDIPVAEEIDPIANVLTARTSTVTFAMAEATVSRLALALGAGATATNDGTAFELPDPSAMVAIKLVWDSDETAAAGNRRWLFRSCKPSGSISIARQKAPNKSTIPVTFNVSKASNGAGPIKVFPNASGLV